MSSGNLLEKGEDYHSTICEFTPTLSGQIFSRISDLQCTASRYVCSHSPIFAANFFLCIHPGNRPAFVTMYVVITHIYSWQSFQMFGNLFLISDQIVCVVSLLMKLTYILYCNTITDGHPHNFLITSIKGYTIEKFTTKLPQFKHNCMQLRMYFYLQSGYKTSRTY